MVQMTTVLDVADNSGAKRVFCIKVLGGSKRKYASVGDIIVVSVKEAIPNAKVKKGDVAKAVIVRTKPSQRNQEGGIVEKEAAIHLSNVMPVDPGSDKPTRVKVKSDEGGARRRVGKSGTVIEVPK